MLLTVLLGTFGRELGCAEADGATAVLKTLGGDRWDEEGKSEDGGVGRQAHLRECGCDCE